MACFLLLSLNSPSFFLTAFGDPAKRLDIGVEVAAHVLVEDHEQGDELPVHAFGRTVRIGASTPRDYDGADKAGIDVDAFVIVRMIEPDYGSRSPLAPVRRVLVRPSDRCTGLFGFTCAPVSGMAAGSCSRRSGAVM